MMITLLASLGVLLGGTSAVLADVPSSETSTIIYLVRHAEAVLPPYKEDPPNPPLNEEGGAQPAEPRATDYERVDLGRALPHRDSLHESGVLVLGGVDHPVRRSVVLHRSLSGNSFRPKISLPPTPLK